MKKFLVLPLFCCILFSPAISTASLNTKLLHAIQRDDLANVKNAIDAGADVNAKDSLGDTPLIEACKFFEYTNVKQKYKIIKLLIEKGAKVNMRGNIGNTPLLQICSDFGKNNYSVAFDIVQLLINKGANINYISPDTNHYKFPGKQTPLQSIIIQINNSVSDNYNPGANIKIYAEGIKIVKYLLKQGARINRDNKELLEQTIIKGSAELVTILMKYRAKIRKSNDKKTGLHLAAASLYQPVEKMEIFYKEGININTRDASGKTPLLHLLSSRSGQDASIKYLINKKADVNAVDRTNNTPLIYAIKNFYSPAILQLLIKSGASVNYINQVGETPLQILREKKYTLLKLKQIKTGFNTDQEKNLKTLNDSEKILLANKAIKGKKSLFNLKDFEKTVISKNYKRLSNYCNKKIVFNDYFFHPLSEDTGLKTRQQALQKIKDYSIKSFTFSGFWSRGIKFDIVITKPLKKPVIAEIVFFLSRDAKGRLWLKKIQLNRKGNY